MKNKVHDVLTSVLGVFSLSVGVEDITNILNIVLIVLGIVNILLVIIFRLISVIRNKEKTLNDKFNESTTILEEGYKQLQNIKEELYETNETERNNK